MDLSLILRGFLFNRKVQSGVVLLVLSLLACLPAYAEDGDLKLQGFTGGYTLFTRENIWIQNLASISNKGESGRHVRIEIPTEDPNHGKLISIRNFHIPAESRVSIPIVTRQGDIPASRARETKGLSSETPIMIYDQASGEKLIQNFRRSMVVPANSFMIGIIGEIIEPGDSYSYISKKKIIRSSRIITSNSSAVPTRWFGHSMIDVAMINGMDVARYRPSQLQGIMDWVQKGGVLAVLSSEFNKDIISEKFEQLCGVSVVGVHRAASLDITSRIGNYGDFGTVQVKTPFPMTELCVDDAEVLYEANGLPLITRKAFGDGWVLTFACTAGALNADEFKRVWNVIPKSRGYKPSVDSAAFAGAAGKTLSEIAGRKSVSERIPAGIILILAVVGGGIWVVRLRTKSSELAWVALVPLCLVVAFAMGWWGMNQSDPERLSYVSLVSGGDKGSARVQSYCSYYPGGQSTEKTFTTDSTRAIIKDAGKAGASAMGTVRMVTGNTLEIPKTTIQAGATKALFIDEVKPVDVVDAQVSFDAKGLVANISNKLTVPLNDTVFYANGRIVRIGDIFPKQSFDASGFNDSLRELGDYTGKATRSIGDQRRNQLLFAMNPYYKRILKAQEQEKQQARKKTPKKSAAKKRRKKVARKRKIDPNTYKRQISDSYIDSRMEPVLIAHANYCPATPLGADDKTPTQGMCLITMPVKVIKPKSGTQVLIPSAWISLDLHKTAFWSRSRQEFTKTNTPGRLEFHASPVKPVGKLKDVTVNLKLNITAPDFDVEINGVPTSSKKSRDPRVLIKKFKKPDGIITVSIPQADRFVSQDGSSYKLEIKVSKAKALVAGQLAQQQSRAWQVQSIEVSLEGIAQ